MNNNKISRPYFAETSSRTMGVMRVFTALICLLWSGAIVIGAVDTHYVSLQGTNDSVNGYITWSGAATDIQWAVSKAGSSDTVLVSNGTYNLTNQISIAANITVRSFTEQGHGTNDTIVNGNNYAGKPVTNRCFYMTAGVLDGFTISNGYASGASGGGVCLGDPASGGEGMSVNNCFIYQNYCSNAANYSGGGGVYMFGKGSGNRGSTVYNCAIVSNIVYDSKAGANNNSGGGVFLYYGGTVAVSRVSGNVAPNAGGMRIDSYGLATNCIINGNRAYVSYGGLDLIATIARNCVISNNVANSSAAGVRVMSGGRLLDSIVIGNRTTNNIGGVFMSYAGVVSNCQIIANVASSGTGGIETSRQNGPDEVINCTIANNLGCNNGTYGGGGGLYAYSGGRIKNCLIYGNTNLGYNGGGANINFANDLYPADSNGLYNCTIVGNQASTLGGGLYAKNANNYIVNCIIYSNNTTNDVYDEIYNQSAGNTNKYWQTCLRPTPGAADTTLAPNQGNITNNPLFVDQVNRNYRLNNNSPCINAGANQNWMTNSYDLDGLTRIRYGRVDMGAYELIYSGTIYCFH